MHMTGSPKIAFIGAGSVEFTRMLIGDLLGYPELRGATLSLHDIDEERLATAEQVAQVTAREADAAPAIEAHLDRRGALDGADYAINMIQVGGHAATVLDYEIPARYGLRQTIGDTLGIGGIFRALRTIPVMQGIAADMADVSPDAWLLNYTNPMAMLCWATYAGTPQRRIVGLCHSVQNTTRQLAELHRRPVRGGHVPRRGRQPPGVDPALRARRSRISTRSWTRRSNATPELRRHVRVELYKRLGRFPTESSEHSAEYLPWLMRDDEAIERFRLQDGEYVQRSLETLREYEETKALLAAGRPLPIEPSVEYAPQIIHSIETGEPRTIYGNVENAGLIENLPRRRLRRGAVPGRRERC